jgi:beta-carotene 3-hydroxylase
MIELLAALSSFAAMEGVSYALHRWVMHGFGMGWHRSHHRTQSHGFERNDRFPVVMAVLAIALFALSGGPSSTLFWCAVGVTAYGAAYVFVHDVYIHERLGVRPPRLQVLERLRRRHAVHHEQGGEPYGMLLPWTPRSNSRVRMRSRRARL